MDNKTGQSAVWFLVVSFVVTLRARWFRLRLSILHGVKKHVEEVREREISTEGWFTVRSMGLCGFLLEKTVAEIKGG